MQPKTNRRVYGAEFKTQVRTECQQSGASVAVRIEAEKYRMMAALNVVKCVAFVGADKPRR